MGRNWGRNRGRGAYWAVAVAAVAAASVTPVAAGAAPAVPAQAAPLTVSVSPSTGLHDEQVVTVSGTGLTPGGLAIAAECVTFPPPPNPPAIDGCQTSPGSGSGVADAAGNVSISVQLDAILLLAGGSIVNDCRTGFTCSFKLLDVTTGQTVSQQIQFVSDAPLVPGVLTVTPSTGLVDGQSVTVSGTNFDSALTLAQCVRGAGCDIAGADAASLRVAPQGGAFTRTLVIAAFVGTTDCRVAGACDIRVLPDDLTEPGASVPITLVPGSPLLPAPTVTVTPSTDLVDGQTITVAVTGMHREPGRTTANVNQCTDDLVTCDRLKTGVAIATNGTLSTTATVHASVGVGGPSPSACLFQAPTGKPCVILVTPAALDSHRAGRAPIELRQNGPLPTATLTMTPATGLGEVTQVTITGTGFERGVSVSLKDCAVGTQVCSTGPVGALPGEDRSFTLQAAIESHLHGAQNQDVDCLVTPCQLVATQQGADVTLPLDFGGFTRERYRDQIFDQADPTLGVNYRQATISGGGPVQLQMDVYQPSGDTSTTPRAAIMMFQPLATDYSPSMRVFLADDAREFAKRGYVVAVVDYRSYGAPTSLLGTLLRLAQAHEDGVAAAQFLVDHAADYNIDPAAIMAVGDDLGAAVALDLAYLPGQFGPADVPMAGVATGDGFTVGTPDAGEPPVLDVNGDHNGTAAYMRSVCASAMAVGDTCLVEDPVRGVEAFQSAVDVIRNQRVAEFLADAIPSP